jgi:hypothetical protein
MMGACGVFAKVLRRSHSTQNSMNYWIYRKKSSGQEKPSSRNRRLECSGEKNDNIHDFNQLATRGAELGLSLCENHC